MKTNELYEKVAAEIIDLLSSGQVDGSRAMPWNTLGHWPKNQITGKEYNGFNALILMMIGNGRLPLWGAFNQWKSIGGSVRKGSKGVKILVPLVKKITNDDGTEDSLVHYKTATVFNIDQIEGVEVPEDPACLDPNPAWQIGEEFIERTGANFGFGNGCFYRHSADEITMVPKEQFVDSQSANAIDSYYSSFFHELVHWTGHDSRLDRNLQTHNKIEYAFEELVAEIGASFVCARLNMTSALREDHADYVANWIQLLKDKPKSIMEACSAAQKATDFLFNLQNDQIAEAA